MEEMSCNGGCSSANLLAKCQADSLCVFAVLKVLGDKVTKAEAFNGPSKHFQHLDVNREL